MLRSLRCSYADTEAVQGGSDRDKVGAVWILTPLSRLLREIHEKKGSVSSVSQWSYVGFPCFGVERYSSVVLFWKRRVSSTLNFSF